MNDVINEKGFAIVCDIYGKIKEVLRNQFDLIDQEIKGKLFADLVALDNLDKAMNFFMEVKSKGAAFDWELNVNTINGIITLHFAGGLRNDEIIIVAAKSRSEIISFYEGMMAIGNEQVNMIRTKSKEIKKKESISYTQEKELYELTKLNNELGVLQRDLSKKNIQLEKLNELKNRFLGMAAHDLRNPIGSILSYCEILIPEIEDRLKPDELELLESIKELSEFMVKLINDLLDVSKIESGNLDLDLKSWDLISVIKSDINKAKLFAQKKEIEIKFNSQMDTFVFRFDKNKIEQVMSNLITNAIKFSHPGSKVEIKVEKENNDVIIYIKDDGQGIKEEEIGLLFKPFSKTSTRSTGGEKSTGLGLSIVKRIVEGHNGKIDVMSVLSVGTTFKITMPIVQ